MLKKLKKSFLFWGKKEERKKLPKNFLVPLGSPSQNFLLLPRPSTERSTTSCRKRRGRTGPCQAPASSDSCSTRQHRCSDRHSWRRQGWWHGITYSSATSLCRLPFPHLFLFIYFFPLPSPASAHTFSLTPQPLNPPSARRHGRQAATQTGDRKQLINIVTPLHLPGPIQGGELSANKTKQPPTHTLPHTRVCLASGSEAHEDCHSKTVEACRHKIFTTHCTGSDMTIKH